MWYGYLVLAHSYLKHKHIPIKQLLLKNIKKVRAEVTGIPLRLSGTGLAAAWMMLALEAYVETFKVKQIFMRLYVLNKEKNTVPNYISHCLRRVCLRLQRLYYIMYVGTALMMLPSLCDTGRKDDDDNILFDLLVNVRL